MVITGKIDYEILADGTCSYCGSEAERHEIWTGEIAIGGCSACDEYNSELEIDISIARKIWEMENQEEEFLQGG